MRRNCGPGLITLVLAGCGGTGYIGGTVDDRAAGSMHVGMARAQ